MPTKCMVMCLSRHIGEVDFIDAGENTNVLSQMHHSMETLYVIAILYALCNVLVSAKQPHILVVIADDYGWNDIGYHGSEIKTPNLDR